jgi:2-polyprenyl-3-methyl-5-hydroxy-6-metoxy-1,4-benzoquinol methylase
MNAATCPACGGEECEVARRYSEVPAFQFPVSAELGREVVARDLALHICRSCGHLFQPTIDPALMKLIYEKYYAFYSFDTLQETSQVYRRSFMSMFDMVAATLGDIRRQTLLEIGCSKGESLAPFRELGFACLGIDPSPLLGSPQSDDGIRLISGYYEQIRLPEKVNVIVSRFVLEHTIDAMAHVGKMSDDLVDGGLVFVQVPNVAYYVDEPQPFFVAHEHAQYFSLRSLVELFASKGFAPVTFYESGQPSIVACFRKQRSDGVVRIASNVYDRWTAYAAGVDAAEAALAPIVEQAEHRIFYGCGLTFWWVFLITAGRAARDARLIDDSPASWGLWAPTYCVEIVKPDAKCFDGHPTVILTLSAVYHDRAIERLRQYGRPMTVVRLSAGRVERLELDGR